MSSLFYHWQLRTKIMFATAVAIVCCFSVMVWIIASTVYNDAKEQGYTRAHEEADAYAKQVTDQFAIGFTLPEHLAQMAMGMKNGTVADRPTLVAIIKSMLAGFPDASGLWMLMEPNALDGKDAEWVADWPTHDPTGRFMPYITQVDGKVAADFMLGVDQQKLAEPFRTNVAEYKPPYEQPGWGDFYYVPKQRQADTITEPFPYEVQDKKVLMSSLVVAMKDSAGKFLGVSAIDVPLSKLQDGLSKYKPYGTGHLTLVSNGGLYVVSADAKKLGQAIEGKSYPSDFMNNVKAGKGFEYEEEGWLHVWRPIQPGKTGQYWSLGVSIPVATITEAAVSARNKAILISLLAAVFVLGVVGLLVTQLTKPLDRLATAMETLAGGEGDLTRRLEVNAHDEIGRTSIAFNQFMEKLRDMFVQVQAQSVAVGEAAEKLSRSADQVEHASNLQAESATATAASVEEVTVSIQHIAQTARDFENSARATGNATSEGQSLVTEVASEMAKVNESVSTLAATMQNLGHQSAKVDTIVKVIKDIADQTNLLALNAAIEAARAGEQGRGFAVVADEVRKLAARTTEATVEIGNIVHDIQGEINAADSNMRATRDLITGGVDISQKTSQAISAVKSETDNLISNVSVIADSTREQAAASTDIAQNVERISAMAQQNSGVVRDVADAVDELERLSNSLGNLVRRFRV